MSIIHTGIYWLFENATTCMVIFHIGIYGVYWYSSCLANSKTSDLEYF